VRGVASKVQGGIPAGENYHVPSSPRGVWQKRGLPPVVKSEGRGLRKVDGCDPGGTFAPGATAAMPRPSHMAALSVRQPWAALLVGGRKTVEVRTWPTKVRGAILIHAGKVPDKRPDGWKWVDSTDLSDQANLTGGVIGIADLVDCLAYRSAEAFAADRDRHRNPAEWFRPPVLYGFRFENPRPVRFEPYKGNTFFFPVEGMSLS